MENTKTTEKRIPTEYQLKLIKDMQEIFLEELNKIAEREKFDITCILHITTLRKEAESNGAIGFLCRGTSKMFLGALQDCSDRIEEFKFKHLKGKLDELMKKIFRSDAD
jgi:hypothetical protein